MISSSAGALRCLKGLLLAAFLIVMDFASGAQTLNEHASVSNIGDTTIHGYYDYLPSGYSNSDTTTYPMILFLHGIGQEGNGSTTELPNVLSQGLPTLLNNRTFPKSFTVNGNTYSFIVIVPQMQEWDSSFRINTFLDTMIRLYRVDTNRIYLTGLSMGGGESWDYLSEYSSYCSRFAAAAIIAGDADTTKARVQILGQDQLPVWAFHDQYDPLVPYAYSEHWVNGINTYNPNPLALLTTFYNDYTHPDAWDSAYKLSFKPYGLNVYQWMLQYAHPVSLGIDLRSFSAEPGGNGFIQMQWEMNTTQVGEFFVVQRSGNGQDFRSIATLGTQHSVSPEPFSYRDKPIPNPGSLWFYYRLKIIHPDGTLEYSPIVGVEIHPNQDQDQVSPDPFASSLDIRVDLPDPGPVLLCLFDAAGRKVMQSQVPGSQGWNTLHLDGLSSLVPGTYFLKLSQKGFLIKTQLVKD